MPRVAISALAPTTDLRQRCPEQPVMTHLRLSLFNALLAHYQPSIDDFDSLVAIEVLILLRSKSD